MAVGRATGNRVVDRLIARRYVVPLREGGSLPAIVETDAGARYVVKFRGAGQGPRALVAELIAARLGQRLGLPIPRVELIDVAERFGLGEPDPEIQDLLRFSVGVNFGISYLPGAIGFDIAVDRIDPELAASIVWFDAYLTNVDRTPRNPNLLLWEDRVWLIDHGAALTFHHTTGNWRDRADDRFPPIRDHVLLNVAGDLRAADERLRQRIDEAAVAAVLDEVPDDWLADMRGAPPAADQRAAYADYLLSRLAGSRPWLEEAIDARE